MTNADELRAFPAGDIKVGFNFLHPFRAPRVSQGRAVRGKLRSSIECATQGHGRCRGIACGCACHCGDGLDAGLTFMRWDR